MSSPTLRELLDAASSGDPAIGAPQRETLDFAGLRRQVEKTAHALDRSGLGRNDRVAIVLRNGPEMASAFLSVASVATAAPLNPAYGEEEFRFYLSSLGARALLAEAGRESPARAASVQLGVPVLELHVAPGSAAGEFEVAGEPPGASSGAVEWAEAEDTALVLHTSGTTALPKVVPLSHRNLCASAGFMRRALRLSPEDRGINVMPLFHIHGLTAGLLAPLGAGASVFCSPGFDAGGFFEWMEEAAPTYLTAVPSMYQAILAEADQRRDAIERAGVRLVRCASAPLPPQVRAELGKVFGAPVVEGYGMTEAAHSITCDPLPPAVLKPGTAGIAFGGKISVVNEFGEHLPPDEPGEVVVCGDCVMRGYANNPSANAKAFVDEWFRTGDLGAIDEDGYLTIKGRFKEMIHCGGKRVSPREVDEAMMDHPAVRQVVVFPIPHDELGEELAAAVTLRAGMRAAPDEIADFVAERLPSFKVPARILIMDEIPKGPTGKLRRIGMAAELGLEAGSRDRREREKEGRHHPGTGRMSV